MHWSILVRRVSISQHLRRFSSFLTSSPKDSDRTVEAIPADEIRKQNERFESPEDARIAKTVIIGCPNAGKSVLTNSLVDAPISAVSSKVHTTRKTTRGTCLLDEKTQLLVLDTPGVVTSTRARRHELEESLLKDPDGAMLGAETACVVVDAADKYTRDRLDPRIQHLLYRHRYRLKSVLVLTKVDIVKAKRHLLDMATKLSNGMIGGIAVPAQQQNSIMMRGGEKVKKDIKPSLKLEEVQEKEEDGEDSSTEMSPIDRILRERWSQVHWSQLEKIETLPWPQVQESALRKCFREEIGWPLFDRVFMVSGLTGDGITELREYLKERATVGKWRFGPTVVTDQNPETMVKDVVRAKLMDRLRYHIPYTLDFKVCVWEVNENDVLCIRLDVLCRQERDAKFIIGPKGKYIAEAAQDITQVLRNLFQREVFFRLGVMTKKH